MANTLDAFRAQQKAVEALHARLLEVGALVSALQPQLDRLRVDQELRQVFEAQSTWLTRTQDLLEEVRRFREAEQRDGRLAVVWRWALACLFAVATIGVGEAVRVRATRPYADELDRLRDQAAFAESVQQRIGVMTPAERQTFDRLMKPPVRPVK